MRFFAESILSHSLGFFATLRMTRGEGLRMTNARPVMLNPPEADEASLILDTTKPHSLLMPQKLRMTFSY